MNSHDPAALVRNARIVARYRFELRGELDEDEAMRCFTCDFRSTLRATPVFAWRQIDCDAEPAVVELCEICSAAAEAGWRSIRG
jgi:hypothetical protein